MSSRINSLMFLGIFGLAVACGGADNKDKKNEKENKPGPVVQKEKAPEEKQIEEDSLPEIELAGAQAAKLNLFTQAQGTWIVTGVTCSSSAEANEDFKTVVLGDIYKFEDSKVFVNKDEGGFEEVSPEKIDLEFKDKGEDGNTIQLTSTEEIVEGLCADSQPVYILTKEVISFGPQISESEEQKTTSEEVSRGNRRQTSPPQTVPEVHPIPIRPSGSAL